MANALGRTIVEGEVVIIRKSWFSPEYQDGDRRFCCMSGFGLHGFTNGTGIYGAFLVDGSEARINGYDIGKDETLAYQASLEVRQ